MLVQLKTVPNEARCTYSEVTHALAIDNCCPISNNPAHGSEIKIRYEPRHVILEVAALRAYVDSYRGGRGDVRSMEGMIQQIAKDCAETLYVAVQVDADLMIHPDQLEFLKCRAIPSKQIIPERKSA